MAETIDGIERMAECGRADRRNGCYRRWLPEPYAPHAGDEAKESWSRVRPGDGVRFDLINETPMATRCTSARCGSCAPTSL